MGQADAPYLLQMDAQQRVPTMELCGGQGTDTPYLFKVIQNPGESSLIKVNPC